MSTKNKPLFQFTGGIFQNIVLLSLPLIFLSWQEPDMAEGDADWAFGIFLILFFLSYFVARWSIIRTVNKLMSKNSEKIEKTLSSKLDQDAIKAPQQLKLVEYNIQSDNPKGVQIREKYVQEAKSNFYRKTFTGMIACVVYSFVTGLFMAFSQKDLQDPLYYILGVSLVYIIFLIFRILLFRTEFRPTDRPNKIIRTVTSIFRILFSPKYGAIILGFYLFTIFLAAEDLIGIIPTAENEERIFSVRSPGLGIILLILMAIHIRIVFFQRQKTSVKKNLKLLVLRVFGEKKQLELTFNQVLMYWRHFGSYFTIVDSSFLKNKYRFFSFRSIIQYILVFFLSVLLAVFMEPYITKMVNSWDWQHYSEEEILLLSYLPGILIAMPIYIMISNWQTKRRFTGSLEEIKSRLNKLIRKPRKLDLSYRGLPMYCYNNSWRLAVNEFLKEANLVLMDLRGFSEERQGCEWEADFLLDNFPVNRMVFLADNNNDRDLIHQLLIDRWEYLKKTSPNLNILNPTVRIYVINKENAQDVQGLIDLLFEASDSSPDELPVPMDKEKN